MPATNDHRTGEPDAEAIARAVQTVPAMAGLHGGAFGEVATYLPGRAITGIRITEDTVAVHVIGYYPTPLEQLAAAVRTATAPHAGGLPVTVVVEDLVGPGESAPSTATARPMTSMSNFAAHNPKESS